MNLNNINIGKKIIYNPDSKESLNDRRIFGGNPDGMINFTKMKYQWALNLWDMMEANTWFPKEVQMTGDAKDYKFLSEPEKRMYDLVLAQLIFMDSCFKADTEILTENGWEQIGNVSMETKIAQFDMTTKMIDFSKPLNKLSRKFDGKMIKLSNPYNNFIHDSTFNHSILYRDDLMTYGESKVNPIKKMDVNSLKTRTQRHFIRSGLKEGTRSNLTLHEKLLIAYQADGWKGYKSKKYTTIYFDLVKQYKIENLTKLLKEIGYTYKTLPQTGPDRLRFAIRIPLDKVLSKTFDWVTFDNINTSYAIEFIEEIKKWDSSEVDGQFIYRTKIKENADILQILFTFSGKSHNFNKNECYNIKWREVHLGHENIGYKNSSGITKTEYNYNGDIYCFNMPKGTLIIRQENQISITGNCQTNNLMDNINPYITAPEINACLSRQAYEEANHSKSYAVMVESISENTDAIYEMWKTDKKLSEKNSYIASIYIELSTGVVTHEKILLALFANQILEGIYFYAGFAALYTLAKSGKMLGSAQMIRFIQRDEISHLLLFQNMINSARKERSDLFTKKLEEKVRTMFRKAVELESSWGHYITNNQILGLTNPLITQYIQYLADRRLEAVGYKPEYNVKHPIPWVDGFSSFNDQRGNFFEANIVNYSKGSISFDDF